MRNHRPPHDPTVLRTLRRFFERRLSCLGEKDRAAASQHHVVSHLMEQTVARAALRAAIRTDDAAPTSTDWKHHLMVAALTELRALDATA